MFRKPKDPTRLEDTIDDLLRSMAGHEGDSEEYAQMTDQLVKLYALKEHDAHKQVSPDTKATVISNLIAVAVIVGYERAHVMASKALGIVFKTR